MIKKYRAYFVLTGLLLLNLQVFADDGDPIPCSGDPDDPGYNPNGCDASDAPLDTWVFLLVFMVLALAVWYWYKQRKSLHTL